MSFGPVARAVMAAAVWFGVIAAVLVVPAALARQWFGAGWTPVGLAVGLAVCAGAVALVSRSGAGGEQVVVTTSGWVELETAEVRSAADAPSAEEVQRRVAEHLGRLRRLARLSSWAPPVVAVVSAGLGTALGGLVVGLVTCAVATAATTACCWLLAMRSLPSRLGL